MAEFAVVVGVVVVGCGLGVRESCVQDTACEDGWQVKEQHRQQYRHLRMASGRRRESRTDIILSLKWEADDFVA